MGSAVSLQLIILEGPDGAGKSTLSKELAQQLGAQVVHHGLYPGLSDEALARIYAESMMPAVLGHRPVIMDRCWLSEQIYGPVMRRQNRMPREYAIMLERLALRCEVRLVVCRPPWETVLVNYRERKGQEYVDQEEKLREIWEAYETSAFVSPRVIRYDYTRQIPFLSTMTWGTSCHHVSCASAGNFDAPVLIVGDQFAERKQYDLHYQWPFASFSHQGCSRWLATKLKEGGISENNLCWVNADQSDDDLKWLLEGSLARRHVVALGDVAYERMNKLMSNPGGPAHRCGLHKAPHPQYWKRFRSGILAEDPQPYPLIPLLKELLA